MSTSSDNLPGATVLIVTKNRKEELRRALASAAAQIPPVAETLVIDDGSTDGTTEMIKAEFPSVHAKRFATSAGLIVRRNEGAMLASNAVVVVVDDDVTFSTPHTVAQTLAEFDSARVGAVAIPFVHHEETGDHGLYRAPDSHKLYVTTAYCGCAHAVRRDVFIKLGGYRSYLFHYGEERDYCTRLLNAGYITRLGGADLIDHWVSPKRDESRKYVYGPRNHILFPWHNVPMPYMPIHWAATILNVIKLGVRSRHPWWVLRGIWAGQRAILHEIFNRAPISRKSYKLMRTLQKRQLMALSEVQAQLEPMLMPVRDESIPA